MDDLRQAIKSAVLAKAVTYKQLSGAIGKNDAYVQQFVDRGSPRELRPEHVAIIANMIGISASRLTSAPASPGFRPTIVPGRQLVGDKDFPIYAAAKGGDGHLIVTYDPIEFVKRPSILEGVRDAYGILLTGASMEPAYFAGDMALVHPHLPPARDTDVVLYHVPPVTQEAEAIIKRLVTFNDREWSLKQYNPATEFIESRVEWTICHRVVGKYNAR